MLLLFLWPGTWGSPTVAAGETSEVPRPLIGRPLEERKVLLVGATSDSFPNSYVDTNGNLVGFGVDLMDAVARVMNLPIKRYPVPGGPLQERFRNGEFDFLQSLTQVREREAYIDFSVPFLTLQGAIFVQKHGSPVKEINNLNGRKFAVVGRNSIGDQFLRDRGLQVEVVYVSSVEDGLRLVETGACAATFASQLTALSVVERAGFRNITLLGDPLDTHDVRNCYAVHKGDAQLLARLNEGLAILHRTGEFAAIYDRWFGRFSSPMISRERVVNWALGVLAVALGLTVLALLRQRSLSQRIAGQRAELARQQSLLQALYDNIPMAMCVVAADPQGFRVLSVNRQAEEYLGRPAAGIAGRLLADFAANSEWITQLLAILQAGLTAPGNLREERLLEGSRKRLIFTLVPMTPDETGQARMCVLTEDITERRNLDEEIAQSRKLRAIGELVGGIAHEFNNLLTPVMLKAGEIQLDWSHDARLVAETRLITESVQRAAELTRRLLTFGRKTDRHKQEVHLGAMVNSCFSLLRLTMERRIRWEQDVPADLPPIYSNPTDLNQIILNLIINARDTLVEKLAGQRGEWTPVIRVEARLVPADAIGPGGGRAPLPGVFGWQRLTVRDNGMGMSPEVRERIFEPFYTTKEVGQGTGLGLATVWHLVIAASGRIEVESTPGEGSAFHVYLPMLPGPGPAAAVAAASRVEAGSARVFVAEDDPLVAKTVTTALRRAYRNVVHFPDGAAAWQHLQSHLRDYDLLLLDVNMPGLDGIELAQRVRTTGRFDGRIVIISGRLGSEDLEQISRARIDCVLSKPFEVAELLGAVRDVLQTEPKR